MQVFLDLFCVFYVLHVLSHVLHEGTTNNSAIVLSKLVET